MSVAAAQINMKTSNPPERASKSRRRFIGSKSVPPLALTWSTKRGKTLALRSWQSATGKTFAEHARCLRVAWILEGLFGDQGFAFSSDAYLSDRLCLPVKKIQDALQRLEKGGAIIRASTFVDAGLERRIWPSAEKIPPTVGNRDTPHGGSVLTPTVGRQISKDRNYAAGLRLSSTQLQARRANKIQESRPLRTRDEGAPAEGSAERCPGRDVSENLISYEEDLSVASLLSRRSWK
jgi:hypothetical protein